MNNCGFCAKVRKFLRYERLVMATKTSGNSLNVQIKKLQVAIAEQNDVIQAARDKQLSNKQQLASLQMQKTKKVRKQ